MAIKHIRVASDLHLEGFTGRNPDTLLIDFIPADERDAESVLVLAGDISSSPDQLFGFIRAACEKFQHVIFVPGNHEYYKHNYDAWNKVMYERLAEFKNLHLALGCVDSVEIEGVRYVFGTLWGDGGFTLGDQGRVGFYLNDFRLIERVMQNNGSGRSFRKFTVQDMMEISKQQKTAIRFVLENKFDGKTVVITHHLPSRRLVSKRYLERDGSDGANGGFVTDCDNMICTLEPWLWIHGHTHDTIDTELWKTRIVCNPAGYRGEYATNFNTYMTSELRDDGTRRAIVQPKFVDL